MANHVSRRPRLVAQVEQTGLNLVLLLANRNDRIEKTTLTNWILARIVRKVSNQNCIVQQVIALDK